MKRKSKTEKNPRLTVKKMRASLQETADSITRHHFMIKTPKDRDINVSPGVTTN
jgi:hypothetical protein